MQVSVETSANALGDREPSRFRVGGRPLVVISVLDRWLAPELSYFKVLASDQTTYILRLDVPLGRWEIALYESGQRPAQPVSPAVAVRQ